MGRDLSISASLVVTLALFISGLRFMNFLSKAFAVMGFLDKYLRTSSIVMCPGPVSSVGVVMGVATLGFLAGTEGDSALLFVPFVGVGVAIQKIF